MNHCYQDVITSNVHCENGTQLRFSEPCNRKCYNEYQERNATPLGNNAMFRCANGHQCVKVSKMCQGTALCGDKSDIEACQDLHCLETMNYTKHVLNTEIVRGHTFCSYAHTKNDGQYHSITREDESNLKIRTKQAIINYEELQQCNVSIAGPGLTCNGKCVPNYSWCRGTTFSCKNGESKISTNDKNLCKNSTFWKYKSCDIYLDADEIYAHGLRCSGKYQHCYYPWYQTLNFFYEEIVKKL